MPTIISRLPSIILRALLLRGTAVWLFVRFMAAVIISAAKAQGFVVGDELVPFWVLLASPALVLLDLQRRKEIALLHNLGVTTRFAVAVGTVPTVLCEVVLAVVTAVRA
ncbi:MAG TPA: hypothetical protein VF128_01810 [Gemmatimonadaceae bacterium]